MAEKQSIRTDGEARVLSLSRPTNQTNGKGHPRKEDSSV
jgi:hypothetical protein